MWCVPRVYFCITRMPHAYVHLEICWSVYIEREQQRVLTCVLFQSVTAKSFNCMPPASRHKFRDAQRAIRVDNANWSRTSGRTLSALCRGERRWLATRARGPTGAAQPGKLPHRASRLVTVTVLLRPVERTRRKHTDMHGIHIYVCIYTHTDQQVYICVCVCCALVDDDMGAFGGRRWPPYERASEPMPPSRHRERSLARGSARASPPSVCGVCAPLPSRAKHFRG